MNEKGLSTLVITVIIIVVSLTAIGIVWQMFGGILESSEEEASVEQSRANLQIVSVMIDGDSIAIKVRRLTGTGEMDGIRFVLSDGASSELFDNSTSLEELEEKTFYFQEGDVDFAYLKTISIAPFVILSSGTKRISSWVDKFTVTEYSYAEGGAGEGGDEECHYDSDCPPDTPGTSACTEGDIYALYTNYHCTDYECIFDEEWRLTELCYEDGCFTENATCISNPVEGGSCELESDCEEDGYIGLPICRDGDIYQNYVYYSCDSGSCKNDVYLQLTEYCYDSGCYTENGTCIPEYDCNSNADCYPDGNLSNSEFCKDGIDEVWVYFINNSCELGFCVNDVTPFLKENCSAKTDDEYACLEGQCLKVIDCSVDSDCDCGEMCKEFECVEESIINSGIVASIWPVDAGGGGEYFNSANLPTQYEEGNVSEKMYVRFPSSEDEKRCLKIQELVYPEPPKEWSYIRFDVETTGVSTEDSYEVWKTEWNCGGCILP